MLASLARSITVSIPSYAGRMLLRSIESAISVGTSSQCLRSRPVISYSDLSDFLITDPTKPVTPVIRIFFLTITKTPVEITKHWRSILSFVIQSKTPRFLRLGCLLGGGIYIMPQRAAVPFLPPTGNSPNGWSRLGSANFQEVHRNGSLLS